MKKSKIFKKYSFKFYFFFLVSILYCNCSSSDNENGITTLTVKNNLTSTSSSTSQLITNIELVGYKFSNIKIEPGDSQTFSLDKGMPEGFKNVRIQIDISCQSGPSGTLGKSYTFSNGKNTIIKIVNCPQVNTGDCGNIVCIE
jgi:hypothetical protein